MLVANRVRLYPTPEQAELIRQNFGAVRHIYNRMLALRRFAFERYGVKISKTKLINRIVRLKRRENLTWLNDADSQALQQAVIHLDDAYNHFFRRVKNCETPGFPRHKSRHHHRQSYQYPQRVKLPHA